MNSRPLRVAIVHYWFVSMRGGEKVIESLLDLFPEADLYTHVVDDEKLSADLSKRNIRTTFINRLPLAKSKYQSYLPLMPLALEQLDLRGYDLVISSESGPAKGVLTEADTCHICYCHTPMRYLWDMYPEYVQQVSALLRPLARGIMHYLRLWDVAAANRVDHFVANSNFIAGRINKHYRREAEVIYPPVDVDEFEVSHQSDEFYLMVGQVIPYKKADLAVAAFREIDARLVIIGEGSLLPELRKTAGPNVEFLGRQDWGVILDHYRRCKALLFPGIEDFGIVPVEAMASGKPVIAFGAGGALETVVDGETGLLFHDQTAAGLADAVRRFEAKAGSFDPLAIRAHAEQFSAARFRAQVAAFVQAKLPAYRG